MKLLFDFFPILLFFIAYKWYGIYAATFVAILATCVQVAVAWRRTGKVEPMHLVTLVLIVLFGGATLVFREELFIKWKPTVLYWLFGLAFLFNQWMGKRTFIEYLLGAHVQLPEPVWRRLNLAWMLFFLTLGFVNLFVLYTFDTATWVNFKLFGILGLTVGFAVLQGIYLSRYASDPDGEIGETGKAGDE